MKKKMLLVVPSFVFALIFLFNATVSNAYYTWCDIDEPDSYKYAQAFVDANTHRFLITAEARVGSHVETNKSDAVYFFTAVASGNKYDNAYCDFR
jgi:hypothetical protein